MGEQRDTPGYVNVTLKGSGTVPITQSKIHVSERHSQAGGTVWTYHKQSVHTGYVY